MPRAGVSSIAVFTPRLSCRAVLFDWDGTLLDSFTAGRDCFARMFRELGVPFTSEKFTTTYSPDWYQMYRSLGLEEERWPEADRLWRKFYAEHLPELIPGAEELLQALRARGIELGIITTGHRSRVEKELERLKVAEFFRVIICGDDCANVKPHPEGIERALCALVLEKQEAVFVGDSPEDEAMARNAGVPFIGVVSQYPTNRLLAESGAILIRSIAELPKLLALA